MKNEITISVRAFPVLLEDERTGAKSSDMLVLSKEQLQAAQLVGQSSKELIYRLYNRRGYKVLEIGKPDKHGLALDLTGQYAADAAGISAPDMPAELDVTNEIKGFLSSYGVSVRADRKFYAKFDAAGLTVSECDASGGGPAFRSSTAEGRREATT